MRLIDADALIEWIDENVSEYTPYALVTKAIVISALKSKNVAPTVEETTRPVFNGRYWECEQCRERYKDILVVKEYKHCPGCGRRISWDEKGEG